MPLTIDFNSANTPSELAIAANTFATQISGEVVSLEDSLDSLTETTVSNCDILGSLSDLVSDATAPFRDAMRKNARDFQEATGGLMKEVGGYIKKLKTKLAEIGKTIKDIFTNISTFTTQLIDKIKTYLLSLKEKLSEVFAGISSVITDLQAAASKLMSDFGKGIKSMLSSGCSVATDAIKSIGTGAGIDAAVSGASGNIDGAMTGVKDSLLSAVSTATESITSTLSGVKNSFDSINTAFA